ncbi:hypothetical protein GLOIN_2v1576063, partial [Rhizophagus irregularis DAOM 181602=DAOM 197198]
PSKYEERRGINYFDYMEVEKFLLNIIYATIQITRHIFHLTNSGPILWKNPWGYNSKLINSFYKKKFITLC